MKRAFSDTNSSSSDDDLASECDDHPNLDSDSGSVSSLTYRSHGDRTLITGMEQWEKHYVELDKAASSNNFPKADKLCGILCDTTRWDRRILTRPWSRMPDDKIRPWKFERLAYPSAYRVIDGIREAWICLLMDYCKWDRAVKIADLYIHDDTCMYLSGRAQMALNKLHALLESRRMREAFCFFQQLLDGSTRMNEILRCIERMHPYQWHYSLARIHFLHNELEKAQHHAEMACNQLELARDEAVEEPLQSRMWVNVIRAWTIGLTCVVSKNATDVERVLGLWERTVCDLDRKSVQCTIGLKDPSVFGRLKFVEFLLIAVRAFPELEINSYADVTRPENSSVISIGKSLLSRLRAVTQELLQRGGLSVEVTNHRYHPLLDQALTQLGYLSTSLEGLLNNWVLVIDAGPVGNQGRFANHTDDPNSVLAVGEASGIRVRVIRAIKPIRRGDEITVHYGANYWDTVTQNRKSTISMKYDANEGPSVAPSMDRELRCSVSKVSSLPAAKRSKRSHKKKEEPAHRVAPNFYEFKQKYEFKFFDGIVSDLNGSGLPALVLLQSLGDMGTSSEAYDMETSCKRKGLLIVDCPKDHAAYPGKMLVADKDFEVGQQICIYAGILSRMPEAQLTLNESDYISTVCQSCCGPYGFELEDVEAKGGAVFKASQRDLPTLTPLSFNGLRIPNADPPVDMSGIHDIRGIGFECTRKLVEALQDDSRRDVVTRLLKRLRGLPDKQWKNHAQTEIRKVLTKPVEKGHDPPPRKEVRIALPRDDVFIVDSDDDHTEEEAEAVVVKTEPDPGLNGSYWGRSTRPVTAKQSLSSGDMPTIFRRRSSPFEIASESGKENIVPGTAVLSFWSQHDG